MPKLRSFFIEKPGHRKIQAPKNEFAQKSADEEMQAVKTQKFSTNTTIFSDLLFTHRYQFYALIAKTVHWRPEKPVWKPKLHSFGRKNYVIAPQRHTGERNKTHGIRLKSKAGIRPKVKLIFQESDLKM